MTVCETKLQVLLWVIRKAQADAGGLGSKFDEFLMNAFEAALYDGAVAPLLQGLSDADADAVLQFLGEQYEQAPPDDLE